MDLEVLQVRQVKVHAQAERGQPSEGTQLLDVAVGKIAGLQGQDLQGRKQGDVRGVYVLVCGHVEVLQPRQSSQVEEAARVPQCIRQREPREGRDGLWIQHQQAAIGVRLLAALG